MWTSKLFWKLFVVYGGLCLVMAGGFSWIVTSWQRRTTVERLGDSLEQTASLLATSATRARPKDPLAWIAQELESLNRSSKLRGSLLKEEVSVAADDEVATRRESTSGEESQLTVSLPVVVEGKRLGTIRLVRSLADVDSDISQANRGIGLFAVSAALVAVVLSYLIVGSIVRPLAELTEDAQALAADDESLLDVGPRDELGLLGDALNSMQRKLARRVVELKENSERLQTVLGSMVEGVIAVGTDEKILLANDASRELIGMTVDNPLGRPLLAVTRSLAVHSAVVDALASAEPVEKEFESIGPDRRVVSLRATRLPGTPCPGVMVVLHDKSELRRLEKLRQEFVANVSHELKTPLASIKAFAETLKMGALRDPEHGPMFVTRIEEQADRLHQLILDLIQIARMEARQETFELVDIALADAVDECRGKYSEVAAIKGVELIMEPPPHAITVRTDEEGLQTILSNLIDNAIKYTPSGGAVAVRWRGDESFAHIEVADTGTGIPAKHLARIFERFYRADRARSRELGGTGLGLSIVKHLVQSFGGTISVESEPQKGSTFRFSLPTKGLSEDFAA